MARGFVIDRNCRSGHKLLQTRSAARGADAIIQVASDIDEKLSYTTSFRTSVFLDRHQSIFPLALGFSDCKTLSRWAALSKFSTLIFTDLIRSTASRLFFIEFANE